MIVVERSVDIAAPAKAVWEFLADFSRWGAFIEGRPGRTLTVTLVESPMLGVGAGRKLAWVDDKGVRQEWTIKDWQPQKGLKVVAEAPDPAEMTLALDAKSADAVSLVMRYQVDLKGGAVDFFAGFFDLEKKIGESVDEMLARLKATLSPAG